MDRFRVILIRRSAVTVTIEASSEAFGTISRFFPPLQNRRKSLRINSISRFTYIKYVTDFSRRISRSSGYYFFKLVFTKKLLIRTILFQKNVFPYFFDFNRKTPAELKRSSINNYIIQRVMTIKIKKKNTKIAYFVPRNHNYIYIYIYTRRRNIHFIGKSRFFYAFFNRNYIYT